MFKQILSIVTFTLVVLVNGQTNYNSPYSSLGLGVESAKHGAVYNSTGVGISFSSSLFLNTQNPALLSRANNVLFEYGVNLDANWISTDLQKGNSSTMNIHYFGFSLPVSKKWTSSLGYAPLYNKSFSFSDEASFSNGQLMTMSHNGQSSINKVYLGNAYQVINDTARSYSLDIGVEPYFVFGSQSEERWRTLTGNSFSTGSLVTTGIKGWGIKNGLSLRKELVQYPVKVDTVLTEYFNGDKALSLILENEKIKEGKYFIVFPKQKKLKFSPKIEDSKLIEHLSNLIRYYTLNTKGIFVKESVIGVSDEKVIEELKALKDSSLVTSFSSKAIKEYYKKGSGVFVSTGVTFEAESKLSLSVLEQQIVQNVASTVNVSTDTIVENSSVEYLPSTIGIGFGIEKPFAKGYHKDGTKRTGSWAVGTDLKFTDWSKSTNTTNTFYVGLGGEYTPDGQNRNEKNSERGELSKYVRRIVYRAGFNYATLPYKLGGEDVSRLGINFGLSLPVGTIRSYTRPRYFNVGFSYEQIGDVAKNGLKEQLFRTTFSFTMNERWFRKWKIGF